MPTDKELMQQALDALINAKGYIFHNVLDDTGNRYDIAIDALRARLAQPEPEPVAWRDRVEQRLLTWRQSFVNRSGDQLALDDFMDKQSLDDLIDFVCDEYTTPPQRKEEPEPVAWADMEVRGEDKGLSWVPGHFHKTPLYTAPPQREWQGLTDEELDQAMDYWSDPSRSAYGGADRANGEYVDMKDTWRYIEAKLKEKNHG